MVVAEALLCCDGFCLLAMDERLWSISMGDFFSRLDILFFESAVREFSTLRSLVMEASSRLAFGNKDEFGELNLSF